MIPQTIHFIWVGGPLPRKYFGNVRKWADQNRKYKIKVWLDSGLYPTDEDGQPQVGFFDDAGKTWYGSQRRSFGEQNISVSDLAKNGFLNQMKNGNFFLDETLGTSRNLGAASDILRVEILLKEGGIYMDTDTYPRKPLPAPMPAQHGVLLSYFYNHDQSMGTWCNAVIAAEPNNSMLLRMRHLIAESYGRRYGLDTSAPEIKRRFLETKKKFEARKKASLPKHDKSINQKIEQHRVSERVDSTVAMTGPGLVTRAIVGYMEQHPDEFDQTKLGTVLNNPNWWKDRGYIFPKEFIDIRSENTWV